MSRRLTPYLFAGVLGVVSGVYIFKPFFEAAIVRESRGATRTVSSTGGPRSDTAFQPGK